jgi:hypothetical protein
MQRGEYDTRGPAADGSFGEHYPDLGGREERREERHERRDAVREDRREDWQEFGEDDYDDGSYGGYYDEEVLVYWTLPCRPNVIAMGGVTYYVCGSAWYTRAYSEGDVVYTVVPNPTGH